MNRGQQLLRKKLVRHGLQRTIAQELQIDETYLSRVATGAIKPNRQVAFKLFERFGIGLGLWDEPVQEVAR